MTENHLDKLRRFKGCGCSHMMMNPEGSICYFYDVEEMLDGYYILKEDAVEKSKIDERISKVKRILAGCRELQKGENIIQRGGQTITSLETQEIHLELLLDELQKLRDSE